MIANHRFLNLLRKSIFVQTLLSITNPIYENHIELFQNNPNLKNFEEFGTEKEKHLKSIRGLVGLLQFYFDDLEKVNLFLAVDKSKLKSLIGTSLDIRDYYQYHYDNFVIRIITSLDLCARLGWRVYNIDATFKNIYPYHFIEKVKGSEASKHLKEFSELLNHIKEQRKFPQVGRYARVAEISRKAFINATTNGEWLTRANEFMKILREEVEQQRQRLAAIEQQKQMNRDFQTFLRYSVHPRYRNRRRRF